MSAEIIQFTPPPRHEQAQTGFPIADRSVAPDPDKDRVDGAPSEYLPSDWQEK